MIIIIYQDVQFAMDYLINLLRRLIYTQKKKDGGGEGEQQSIYYRAEDTDFKIFCRFVLLSTQ